MSRKWLLVVCLRPLVILFGHGVIFFSFFFQVAFSVVSSRSSPEIQASPLFLPFLAKLSSFFFPSHGCAARKIFKSILRPVCLLLSHSPLPATIARLSFCPIARDDAIIGRANTRRPRKITIIPPQSFVKFGALVKPRETVVTCKGSIEGRLWVARRREDDPFPKRSRGSPAPIVKSIPSRRDFAFRGDVLGAFPSIDPGLRDRVCRPGSFSRDNRWAELTYLGALMQPGHKTDCTEN